MEQGGQGKFVLREKDARPHSMLLERGLVFHRTLLVLTPWLLLPLRDGGGLPQRG